MKEPPMPLRRRLLLTWFAVVFGFLTFAMFAAIVLYYFAIVSWE